MKISVIIPAYNEEKVLEACLKSVLIASKKCSVHEIIVVDNASTDKTSDVAKRFSNVLVVNEPNKGTNWARERGFIESSGEILAYLDADSTVPENWFEVVTGEFENDEKLVLLSGPSIFPDLPLISRMLVWIYWHVIARISYFVIGYMALGSNMILRRDALQKAGGFNTELLFYGDDTDMARRMSKVGKLKFKTSLKITSSSRRLKSEGLIKSAFLYGYNFLSEVIFGHPATKNYKDIR